MKEKALLVGLNLKNSDYDIDYYLDELKNLAQANDIEVCERIYQTLEKPNNKTYVGQGKLEEIKIIIQSMDITLVIFDDELTPSQMRNIEDILECKIIDRSMLILDIFAKRAKTKQAVIEVKMAQLRYLLPRLNEVTQSLSRQGGSSFNAKGPGEKQIDLDRRRILKQLELLKKESLKQNSQKEIENKKRLNSNIPIVALVGYTNAGKSSTMNKIISEYGFSNDKNVYAKDMLFATLEASSRYIKLDNNQEFILMDTVGFVSKLPHHLVGSFYQTLATVKYADILIHVLDASSPYLERQMLVTNTVLKSLDIMPKKTLYLLNKCDMITETVYFKEHNSLFYSNKTGHNFDELINFIKKSIKNKTIICELNIPYTDGKSANFVEEKAIIMQKLFHSTGTYYKIEIEKRYFHHINQYIEKS